MNIANHTSLLWTFLLNYSPILPKFSNNSTSSLLSLSKTNPYNFYLSPSPPPSFCFILTLIHFTTPIFFLKVLRRPSLLHMFRSHFLLVLAPFSFPALSFAAYPRWSPLCSDHSATRSCPTNQVPQLVHNLHL